MEQQVRWSSQLKTSLDPSNRTDCRRHGRWALSFVEARHAPSTRPHGTAVLRASVAPGGRLKRTETSRNPGGCICALTRPWLVGPEYTLRTHRGRVISQLLRCRRPCPRPAFSKMQPQPQFRRAESPRSHRERRNRRLEKAQRSWSSAWQGSSQPGGPFAMR
jgi:hypothetical protein